MVRGDYAKGMKGGSDTEANVESRGSKKELLKTDSGWRRRRGGKRGGATGARRERG